MPGFIFGLDEYGNVTSNIKDVEPRKDGVRVTWGWSTTNGYTERTWSTDSFIDPVSVEQLSDTMTYVIPRPIRELLERRVYEITAIAQPVTDSEKLPRFLVHRFHLRAGLEITFQLPEDLSKSEAERLARMIVTLPIK